jgi:hypothetical protein
LGKSGFLAVLLESKSLSTLKPSNLAWRGRPLDSLRFFFRLLIYRFPLLIFDLES